jgi:hypothetical protein
MAGDYVKLEHSLTGKRASDKDDEDHHKGGPTKKRRGPQ